ncbi:MAG: tRNA preQ1(34) S-adenosylmethionine ribosyltransferase-isomerase QueA [Candidatus Woesearchaeota archaeon]
MKLEEFDYHLPPELIAQRPAHPKSYSRMLIADTLTDSRFYRIKDHLKKDDLIVLNNTKVKRAKLLGQKETGSPVEVIILQRKDDTYKCRIKGKPRLGNKLIFKDNQAKIIDKQHDLFTLRFRKEPRGILPTPPYINEELKRDTEYQTVYAREEGSLAAPTAGLHFTSNLMRELKTKGVKFAYICLHVGYGTFNKIYDLDTHQMEPEFLTIDKQTADTINNRKGRLFVIGTTTMKSLETAADNKGIIHPYQGYSDLFIKPGYGFRINPDGFITNFHLPESTLLLLISAYMGKENVFRAYNHAIQKRYRFYSLGDCMLISQPQKVCR